MKRLFLLLALCGMVYTSCEGDAPVQDDGSEQPAPGTDPDPGTDPEPEKPLNYVEYNGTVRELCSMCYIINDTGDMGVQYALAMTPSEGVERFDDIIAEDEYLFLSLSEEIFFDAIENHDGRIDAMSLDLANQVYMFIAKLGEFDIEDYAYDHFVVTRGDIELSYDEATRDIACRAHYETMLGDVITVVARLEYEEPEVIESNSYFKYVWGDVTVDSFVGSAYVEQTPEAVIYTICKDSIKTYVYYEDTPFLKLEVAGMSLNDDFEIDVASFADEFSLWACDPIKGMDLRVSNSNRANCSGKITVKDGRVKCENLRKEDVEVNVYFGDDYREVNECVSISYDERSELFKPCSVVLDNSGDSDYKIYVSSKSGITSVEGMISPDIVITYPKEGWDKWLMKRNFISGSSYPDMTFKYKKSTYKKGEGDCLGMNAQIPEYDAESGRLRLNLNLYTEEGGIALYYSGEFTLVE